MDTMTTPFTLRDWVRLPEGFPAQLFDGQLVREPAPTYGHQDLVGRLYLAAVAVVPAARVVLSPTDVVIDDLNVLQPDVAIVARVPPRDSHDIGIPLVAFEVLSPSTAKRDRRIKSRKYLEAGVREVWIADPQSCTIEMRTATGDIRVHGDEAVRSSAVPGLELVPRTLFGDQ